MRFILSIILLFLISSCDNNQNSFTNINSVEYLGDNSKTSIKHDLIIKKISYFNTTQQSNIGEFAPYVILYNNSNDSIELSDYYLSDNEENLTKFRLPKYSLAPKDTFFLFLGGDLRAESDIDIEPYRANFSNVWAWSDYQMPTPGHSRVYYYEIDNNYYKKIDNDSFLISGTLKTGDNSDIGLSWSTAQIHGDLDGYSSKKGADLSNYDFLNMRCKISKDKSLRVTVVQVGLESWKGYYYDIVGTGDYKDYSIPLPNDGILDKKNIYAIEWSVPGGIYDSLSFTVNSIKFTALKLKPQANFKLQYREILYVTNINNGLVDKSYFLPTILGQSLYRDVNSGEWFVSNELENSEIRAKLSIETLGVLPNSGFFNDSVVVKMLAQKGHNIYYTTNGIEPTTNSLRYTKPILLKNSTSIKAKIIDNNYISETITKTYLVNKEHQLPVISIVVDSLSMFDEDSGIYMLGPNAQEVMPYYGANFWQDKELPIHITMFDKYGGGFSVNAGLKIFGNYSRTKKNKAFSIHFKGKYGLSKLNYPLFGGFAPNLKIFDSFILRTDGNNSTFAPFHDAYVQTFVGLMGVDHQKYRPAVLYINGEYWGIYNIREKLNTDYIENNYGYPKDNISIFKDGWTSQAGDCSEFLSLSTYLNSGGAFETKEGYQFVSEILDIDNTINYYLSEMFIANQDWPANNFKVWKYNINGFKWRYIIYDTDNSFGAGMSVSYKFNSFDYMVADTADGWPNGPESTLLWRNLIKNGEFKRKFINRSVVAVKTVFNSDRMLDSIESFENRIISEKDDYLQRWKLRNYNWTSSVMDMQEFASNRGEEYIKDMENFFNLKEKHNLTLNIEGSGKIFIAQTILNDYPFIANFYKDNLVEIRAVGNFIKWSDGDTSKVRLINPDKDREITAIFR